MLLYIPHLSFFHCFAHFLFFLCLSLSLSFICLSSIDLCLQTLSGDSSVNPSLGRLVLQCLCPALRSLLCDGLKPHQSDLIAGRRPNSPWGLVQASTKPGIRHLDLDYKTIAFIKYLILYSTSLSLSTSTSHDQTFFILFFSGTVNPCSIDSCICHTCSL